MTLEAGLYPKMRADAYHADPCDFPSLSSSIARVLVDESPLHAWTAHPQLNADFARVGDDKFDLGNVVHGVLLEGQAAVELIDAADYRTNAAKEARDAARAAGKVPLLVDQWPRVIDTVTAVRERIASHLADPPLFRDGDAELVVLWREGDVDCRARLDWLRTDRLAIDDLKTTTLSANPRTWARRVFAGGYDVQAEFYSRGVEAVTGVRPKFRLVVVELAPPHAVAVIQLAADAEVIARKKVDYALELWRRCLDSNEWPGYSDQVAFAELPAYEEARWLEQELAAVDEGWLAA